MRVVLIKPSKYTRSGSVERFRTGFMPNATLTHLAALTPARFADRPVETRMVDEYVHCDLDYLDWLAGRDTLVAMVGVQSHQFHRALDLAALALDRGVRNVVIGGPHPMTCDTSALQGRGVSFALAEAERVWPEILADAAAGHGLKAVYGEGQRWATELPPTPITPPSRDDLKRYFSPMVGLVPMRGCPYQCKFCAVIQIAGRAVREQSVDATIESLRRARAGGVETVMFVSDNFNKAPSAPALLEAMIEEDLGLRFFCQCDTVVARQPEFIELLGRAGCFEMFVGVESFSRATLKAAHKYHNHPETYRSIIEQCAAAGIRAHYSNIIGFPQDTPASIAEHLEALRGLAPKVVSFYILTPIPGTEQYEEFRRDGLIWETNMDRFDGGCPTWHHPNMSTRELETQMYDAYVSHYEFLWRSGRLATPEERNIAALARLSAKQHLHPMSGGIGPVEIDRRDDYLALRRARFDIHDAPLPASLKLSARDEETNRQAKVAHG
ncbi:MAG: radical SAM protein [Chromatiales bacterium]|nr:radical SAM protein [Chromatiales bacterium]